MTQGSREAAKWSPKMSTLRPFARSKRYRPKFWQVTDDVNQRVVGGAFSQSKHCD